MFYSACQGNSNCSIDLTKIFLNSEENRNEDCGDKAVFFLQSGCVINPINEGDREVFGLFAASLGVFIYFFVIVYIDYIKSKETNMFVDFDVKTISAGDYSIEFDIESEAYEKFKTFYHLKSSPMSEMA